MSRKGNDKGRLRPFIPLDQEVLSSPAWRAMSHGARWLYVHLKRRWSFKQKGQRSAVPVAARRAGRNGRLAARQRQSLVSRASTLRLHRHDRSRMSRPRRQGQGTPLAAD